LDWWNIPGEHTEWEWAAQVAMYDVSPFGERRQDLRAGYHTAHMIAAQATELDDHLFGEMIDQMISYLPCDRDDGEETADMDALARMKRSQ
jgi:hypothetical protein